MQTSITDLTEKIAALEAELEAELAKRRSELHVGLEKGRVVFEEEILRRHRELRTKLSSYILRAHPLVVLTGPVIYSLILRCCCSTCSLPSIRPSAFRRMGSPR